MPAENILRITDSLTGKELEPDHAPIRLSLGRRSWLLYLSDESMDKVLSQVDKWTKNEPEERTSSPAPSSRRQSSSGSGRSKEETQRIRDWANSHGFTVSDRGRLSAEVVAAYEAAN